MSRSNVSVQNFSQSKSHGVKEGNYFSVKNVYFLVFTLSDIIPNDSVGTSDVWALPSPPMGLVFGSEAGAFLPSGDWSFDQSPFDF